MRPDVQFPIWGKTCALMAAVSILLAAAPITASAQGPGGRPPGGPPPAGSRAGTPTADLPAGGAEQLATGVLPPWNPPELTPAQKIVAALPPPVRGRGSFAPPIDPNGPMPSADPRDLQGTWFHNQQLEHRMQKDAFGNWAPYNMAGAKVISRRVAADAKGTPYANASTFCRPPGPQWQLDLSRPFKIFQSKNAIEFFFKVYHGRWNITLDPAAAPLPPGKQYMGSSIGRWDGNTLVVETSDFKQALWLDTDGTPLSANGKLIQRIRKVDNGDRHPYLEVITTIIDPTYYTQPWSVMRSFGWGSNQVVFLEYNCEQQVGDVNDGSNSSLIAEPKD